MTYIEHGVTALDSYLRAPRFRATLEEITDEVIDDVMSQLSFDETKLDGEAGFADVVGGGVDSSVLSHDESFGVDDMELNLNKHLNLYVSQVETQSKLPVSEEPDVGRTHEPILSEVRTQEPIVAEVSNEVPIVEEVGTQEFNVEDVVVEDYVSSGEDGEDAEQGNGQEDKSAPTNGQFFYDDEGIDTAYETEYDVQYSEYTGTDDDDDVNEDFLADEENEIVEPDVDVHLFGISMDLPFDNIGITNLVPDDVLEGEDVDVINADGFDSDPSNDEEKNYRKRRLAKLRTEMKGVINASGQWKYSFYTGHKFTTPKEAKDRVYLYSIKSRRNLKLYKNDGVRIRARCDGKVPVFIMSQGTGPTGPNRGIEAGPSGLSGPTTRSKKSKNTVKAVQDQLQHELEVQISMSKAFKAKAKAKRDIIVDHVLQYSMLRDYVVELQSTNPNTTVKIAVERNIDPSLPTRVFKRIYICLGALKLGFRACRRTLLGLDGAFIKGPFPGQVLVAVGLDSNNGIYLLAYALVEAESKSSWCWFLQCLGDDIDLHLISNFTFISDRQKGIILAIKTVYPSAEHIYCLRHIHQNIKHGWCGQAYKDLLWRDASATNVRDFKKCKLELKTMNPKAHEWLNKIPAEHWARSHFLGIPCKHDVAACWNITLNDRAVPPPETWVNPCYWLSTWKKTCSHKIQPICGTKYWEKSTCPTTLLPPKHHVQVGRPRKKRKMSKHEDEPFVKDGQLSGNNVEASGSASGQAQQTEPAVYQDGLGGSGAGAVIGLSVAAGEGGVGVASQGSSRSR
ncbi:heat stress transcription factor B-4-like protein [Tanacetum coccineum]